jgi:hypothetical protein
MIDNVPPHLRSDQKLKEYFESLGIGEVETAVLDRVIGNFVTKLTEERDIVLKKLELEYVKWANNMDRLRRKKGNVTWRQRFKHRLEVIPDPIENIDLTPEEINNCRPKLHSFWHRFVRSRKKEYSTPNRDSIDFYSEKLHQLSVQLQQKKLIAIEPALYKEPNDLCNHTGFVTFKTQRAAQIAAQTLLHNEPNPTSFRVKNAPSPRDVNWTGIARPLYRRYLYRYSIAIFTVFLCFFIIVPTTGIITLMNLENLAKTGLKGVVKWIAARPKFRVFVESIIPQLILGLVNSVLVPHIMITAESN